MRLWVNFLDESPLLESTPQEGGVLVEVDPGAQAMLLALVLLDDIDICRSLGQLFLAGVRHAEKDPAGPPTVQISCEESSGADADAGR